MKVKELIELDNFKIRNALLNAVSDAMEKVAVMILFTLTMISIMAIATVPVIVINRMWQIVTIAADMQQTAEQEKKEGIQEKVRDAIEHDTEMQQYIKIIQRSERE